jgi:cytochrome c nitrite reductase small subunit
MLKRFRVGSAPRLGGRGGNFKRVAGRVLKSAGVLLLLLLVLAGVSASSVATASQNASYCSACHVMAPYVASTESQTRLAYVHTQAGVTCQQCHPQTAATLIKEIVSNATGDYHQPLTPLKFSTQSCLECHGTYAALEHRNQDLVRNPHYPMQGQLDCRVCHKAHADQVQYCGKCHDDATLPAVGWVLPPP